MPKNTPFIPANADELWSSVCLRRGIDPYSREGQELLTSVREAWDRAARTNPLQRPQPPSHPPESVGNEAIKNTPNSSRPSSRPESSGAPRGPKYTCNSFIGDAEPPADVAEQAAKVVAESSDPIGARPIADGAEPAWQAVAAARGPSPGGRPRIMAPWFEVLAKQMADGKSLKKAAAILGIPLTKQERRRMYQRREFAKMYQAERKAYLAGKYSHRIRRT